MEKLTPLIHGQYYHIYNKSVGEINLFRDKGDYERFLNSYAEYITPVADTYAWVLMGNHFHLLVRILDEDQIGNIKPSDRHKDKLFDSPKKYVPTHQFAHLFDAYAKYFNARYDRKGSLFIKRFRRIWIDNHRYFKKLVFYIHNNPVHHRFVSKSIDYPWSSYLTVISLAPTRLGRERVVAWFNSKAEFIEYHSQSHDFEDIRDYIIEEVE